VAPGAPATAEFLSRQFQGLDADTVVRLFAGDFAGLEEEVSPELLLFARVIHELARNLLETARSELENLTPEQVAEGMGRIYGFLLYTAAGLLLSAGAATALKGQRIVALAKQLRRLPGLKSPAAQKAIDKLMDSLRLLEPPKRGRADPPTLTAPPLAARPVEEATEIADDLFVDIAPDRPLGGRGPNSGREFDPSKAGGPIRHLSTDRIKITSRGIDFVERHLERFGADPANQAMVQRLRDIASRKIKPTQTDLNFYSHELRESIRYKKPGFPSGQPEGVDEAYDLWNNAHTGTLEDYRLREGSGVLYHPSANP